MSCHELLPQNRLLVYRLLWQQAHLYLQLPVRVFPDFIPTHLGNGETGFAHTSPEQSVLCCRIPGHLKVCSNALYFVPRAVQEPIYRIPYRHTLQIGRLVPASALIQLHIMQRPS